MGLYHNIIHWDYNLISGDHVAWIRYPFAELKLDPIFEVQALNNDFTMDLKVIQSDFLEVGTEYKNQPRNGFRRVKLTTIKNDLTYNVEV